MWLCDVAKENKIIIVRVNVHLCLFKSWDPVPDEIMICFRINSVYLIVGISIVNETGIPLSNVNYGKYNLPKAKVLMAYLGKQAIVKSAWKA